MKGNIQWNREDKCTRSNRLDTVCAVDTNYTISNIRNSTSPLFFTKTNSGGFENGWNRQWNRTILDAGIQDQEQWAQNVKEYMRGLPKPGPMSAASPILIQLKRWSVHKWVSMEHCGWPCTEMHVLNLSNYNKDEFPVSSLYLGTLGGEKGMRDTRVEWTELTWLLITYVWVFFYLHTSWHPPFPPPLLMKPKPSAPKS